MDSSPTFSIVIPSYNYAHYLVETLESVLAQNRSDIEVLLIDDASDDATPQVADKYKEHIQYIRNKQNLGASGAWNIGLERATGKYIIKLDADDAFLPGHLDSLESAFESDLKIGMVFTSVLIKKEGKDTIEPEFVAEKDQVLEATELRQKLLECFLYRMPGCALRRALITGREAPDRLLYQIHDWEYFLRVTKGHKGMLIHEPSAMYRVHTSSISSTARNDSRLYKDVVRWLHIAKDPGERFIEKAERKTLKGSCACLLLFGFGSKSNPMSYLRFIPVYFRTLRIASGGGLIQVKRMHRALIKRMLNQPETNV